MRVWKAQNRASIYALPTVLDPDAARGPISPIWRGGDRVWKPLAQALFMP
jgi:hypothetical protein